MKDIPFHETKTGLGLAKDLQEKKLDPAVLDTESRRLVVGALLLEGWSTQEMARLCGVSRVQLWKDKKVLRKAFANQVRELDVMQLAGEHVKRGIHIANRLQRMGKLEAAWRVRREVIQDLQSLGFILKAPTMFDVNLSSGEVRRLSDAELDARYNALVATDARANRLLGDGGEVAADVSVELHPVLPDVPGAPLHGGACPVPPGPDGGSGAPERDGA